jgi:hypothetical protein
MAYKITGWLEDPAKILIFKESDWSLEKSVSIDSGDFEVVSLASGTKMVAGRRLSDGMVEVYGNIYPIEYLGEDFLSINSLGDLLNINTNGDHLIVGVPL